MLIQDPGPITDRLGRRGPTSNGGELVCADGAGTQPAKHSPAIRALHWATAALITAAYILALSLRAASSAEQTAWLLMLHRSVGVSVLLLTVIRLRVRSRTRLPPWPADLPHWQRAAAKTSEVALYLVLLAQPALGIAASLLRGNVVLFGIPVPPVLPLNRPLGREIMMAHYAVAAGLLALIALHAAAALYHHLIRGDNVLVRMLPIMRRVRLRQAVRVKR